MTTTLPPASVFIDSLSSEFDIKQGVSQLLTHLSERDALIVMLQLAQGAGVFGYATLSAMNADLSHPGGAVGWVTNDAVATNNGIYLKNGASGAGTWVKSVSDPYSYLDSKLADLAKNTFTVQSLFYRNGYINLSGAFVSGSLWRSTPLIEINSFVVKGLSLSGHINASTIAFYTIDGAFISGVTSATTGVPVTVYPTVPAGTAYVTFTYLLADEASIIFNLLPAFWNFGMASKVSAIDSGLMNIDYVLLSSLAGYITTTGTTPNTDNNWIHSDYFACVPGELVHASLIGHPSVLSVSFYNSSYGLISGVSATTIAGVVAQAITVPANSKYFRICFSNPAGSVAPGSISSCRKVINVAKNILAVDSLLGVDTGMMHVQIASLATSAGYVGTSGTNVGSDANWLRSDYIPVAPADTVSCNLIGHTSVNCVSFYNASFGYISGYAAAGTTLPSAVFNQNVIAPAGAAYMRLSFGNPATLAMASGTTPSVVFGHNVGKAAIAYEVITSSLQAMKSNFAKNKFTSRRKVALTGASKIILYGDSISSTDYPWYANSLSAITGASVYAGGYPGYSSAQLAGNANLQRIFDYSPNVIIVMMGTNDSGAVGTVGTFSGYVEGEPVVAETDAAADYAGSYYIQAVSHLIRKLKSRYYNIRASAALTGSETEAEKTAKIDAVLKPLIVMLSPLPQNRNSSADAFSMPVNQQRKRDAVAECCLKYGVHFIDLFSSSPFDMSLEPYWVSPTDKVTNNGIYFMDGLHPNKYGCQIMSEIIADGIGL